MDWFFTPSRRLLRGVSPLALAALAFASAAPSVHAQNLYQWETHDQRIESLRSIEKLGDDLFGDSVSLQNGALSFRVTDVSIPGNNALPVAFGRSWTLKNTRSEFSNHLLGDWMPDLPRISGQYADAWLAGGTSAARCSDTRPAAVPQAVIGFFEISSFWQGMRLDVPTGGGELLVTEPGVAKPSDGRSYVWTVGDGNTHVSCLTTIRNGAGEGFSAVTPDGVRYTFDWMATRVVNGVSQIIYGPQGERTPYSMTVREYSLYATRVEDRFGNRVDYTYTNAWNAPVRLTRIASSDGRQLDLGYNGAGRVTSITDGTRTWQYAYGTNAGNKPYLSRVTRPDGRAWQINFQQFSHTPILPQSPNSIERECTILAMPENYFDEPVGTIVHPSGAVATFRVGLREHGRSNVTLSCGNVTTLPGIPPPGAGNDPRDDNAQFAISYYAWTLLSRDIGGPGAPTRTWSYDYDADISVHLYPGTTWDFPACIGPQCGQAACTSDACAGSTRTRVALPNGDWERYTFGNSWQYNEGKLLKIERGASGASVALETVTHRYDLARTGAAYLARFGRSFRINLDGFESEYHRPQLSSTIRRDGVDYAWSMRTCSGRPCFDARARPLQIERRSTPGVARNEVTQYHDNTALWVMGQVARSTVGGIEQGRADYDGLARPWRLRQFGQVAQTLGYNADGTVAWVDDGNARRTQLQGWYRGVPRTIIHADTTSQTATVNANGWLTSVTDPLSATTTYQWDAMGRLTRIDYPTGDPVAWAPTLISFTPATTPAYGLPAGHWQWRLTQGQRTQVRYFDALLRPVVEESFDASNPAGTRSIVVMQYDARGRQSYQSHPQRSITTASAAFPGVVTSYDALSRVTGTDDAGRTSLVAYLTGGQRRTTNPRGQSVTESFLTYGEPSDAWPTAMSLPEGVSISIARDVFGKPTTMTRGGGGVSVTRRYVYDAQQRLCKQIDPESAASFFDYDAAGNLLWSATGQGSTSISCDRSSVALTERSTRSYDAMNRVVAVDHPGTAVDLSYTYTPMGLLATATAGPNVTTYAYNRRGLPTRETYTYPNAGDYPQQWEYNALGHLSAEVTIGGIRIDFAPNALGQPTQAGSYASGATYDPAGRLASFTYGNGMVRTLTYSVWGEPQRIRDTGGPGVDLGYSYDAVGNIMGIVDHMGGTLNRSGFSYDGLDRLLSVNNPGGFGAASYTYDALDNLRTRNLEGNALTFGYSNNRLTTVTNSAGGVADSFGYDTRGNITSKNARQHRFDAANRLTEIPGIARYEYDAHGRRTLSWRADGTGKIDVYTQDGVLRYTSDNALGGGRTHIYLGGLPIAEQFALWDGSGPVRLRYLHTDALRSVVAGTGPSRELNLSPTGYEAYGKASTPASDRAGFTYHMTDRGSELVYMQQRYYDPAVGRFLSVDPVGPLSDPINHFGRYQYANNNPYRYIDPDGRRSNCLGALCDSYRRASPLCEATCVQAGAGGGGRGGSSNGRRGQNEARSTNEAVHLSVGRRLEREITRMEPGTSLPQFVGPSNGPAYNSVTSSTLSQTLNGIRAERSSLLQRAVVNGELNVSQTVGNQLSGPRSYIPVQSIIGTIRYGSRSPDPQGVPGQSMYRSTATFNGSSGALEVLVHTPSGQIRHVLFRSEN